MGDRYINYDGHDGTIEEVGLRSTRLRRLDVDDIANGELANKSIHNIAKRPLSTNFYRVTSSTSPEKVKEAKAILEDILKDHDWIRRVVLPTSLFQRFFCIIPRFQMYVLVSSTHTEVTWTSLNG